MLLWAILPKTFMKVLEDKVWYKVYSAYEHTVKMYDEQYIEEVTLPDGEVDDICAIQCIAGIFNPRNLPLSFPLLCSSFGSIVSAVNGSLRDYVFVELWADEKDILNAKSKANPYMVYNDKWREDDKRNKWKYAELSDVDEIGTSNFVDYVRKNRRQFDVECMLKAIHDYQVIQICSMQPIKNKQGDNIYKLHQWYTSPYLIPTFTSDVFVGFDGYPSVQDEDGSITVKSLDHREKLCDIIGMPGVYTYMTFGEATSTCNANVCTYLTKKSSINKGETFHTVWDKTVKSIFGTDKFILTVDGEGKLQ